MLVGGGYVVIYPKNFSKNTSYEVLVVHKFKRYNIYVRYRYKIIYKDIQYIQYTYLRMYVSFHSVIFVYNTLYINRGTR